MLQVVEPGNVQKTIQLLPGSKERQELTVDSLEELKRQSELANSKNSKSKKVLLKVVIITTVLSILFYLVYNRNKDKKGIVKAMKVAKKIFTYLGYGAMAMSMIRAFKNSPVSSMEIIDVGQVKQPDIKQALEDSNVNSTPNSVDIKSESDTNRDIRALAVRATLDTLVETGVISPKDLKVKAKTYTFKKPNNVHKGIVKEMVKYGKQL